MMAMEICVEKDRGHCMSKKLLAAYSISLKRDGFFLLIPHFYYLT
jgi:hypothetical protein